MQFQVKAKQGKKEEGEGEGEVVAKRHLCRKNKHDQTTLQHKGKNNLQKWV